MKSRNTMGKAEYVYTYILWLIPAFIWYKNLVFRCYKDLTVKQSFIMLLCIVAVVGFAGIMVTMKRGRNLHGMIMSIVMPFGVYTALNYISIRVGLVAGLISLAVVVSALYLFFVFCRPVTVKRHYDDIIKSRIKHSFLAVYSIFSACLGVVLVVIITCCLFGNSVLYPSVKAENSRNYAEVSTYAEEEYLSVLWDGSWDSMSLRKKLDFLQVIANNERKKLGLPNELNVGAGNIDDEYTLGYYTDNVREIVINIDFLETADVWEAVEVVCHEAYHSYEYRMVELYCNADEELRSLSVFDGAAAYAEEFNNYNDSEVDFYAYYDQLCESDARDYAAFAVAEYYAEFIGNAK